MLTFREKAIIAFAATVLAAVILFGPVGVNASSAGVPRFVGDGFGRLIYRSYPRSQVTLHGRLFNAYGNPAVGEGVEVVVQPLAGGIPSVYQGFTDSAGHYAIHVARGASRLITLSAGGTTREVRELVAPYIWITISMRKYRRVLFTGGIKVSRSTLPPTVLIQDHTPSGWQTFGAVVPNAKSHLWRYVYRHISRGVIGRTYSFRAKSLPTTAWLSGIGDPKEATIR